MGLYTFNTGMTAGNCIQLLELVSTTCTVHAGTFHDGFIEKLKPDTTETNTQDTRPPN